MKAVFFAIVISLMFSSITGKSKTPISSNTLKRNIVKFNTTPLIIRTIEVQYERIVGNHVSVALGLGFMPNGRIPITNNTNNIEGIPWLDQLDLLNSKLSTLKITPEFKFYIKEAGKGFYFAPFLRYRLINTIIPVSYLDNSSQNQHVNLIGKMNSFMFGVMLGSQFKVAESITLDWYIVGGHVSTNNIKLEYSTVESISMADQAELANSFEEFKNNSSRFNHLNYKISSNSGFISGNVLNFGLKGFGLCLGYRF